MSISQVLYDAIKAIDSELHKPGEYGDVLQQEIAALVVRMKEVQRKLDSEMTQLDSGDEA